MVQSYRAESPVTLGVNRKHCYACAAILDVRAELCPSCGVRQPTVPGAMMALPMAPPVPTTTKSRISGALFALFLGGLGVHKFYLGQPGRGVLYLLFCWTFIPAILALIEGCILLGMSDADFARKYPG